MNAKELTVEAGQEVRNRAGEVIARAGETISLLDDQKNGWPLYLIDIATNSVVEELV